jgi:alpha-glucuronidase
MQAEQRTEWHSSSAVHDRAGADGRGLAVHLNHASAAGHNQELLFRVLMWRVRRSAGIAPSPAIEDSRPSTVANIVIGRRFRQPYGGFVSVVNVGLEQNWLHHPMAMANLYGFAKLAWNPTDDLGQIIDRWTHLTWGNDSQVVATISDMLRSSWRTYESYTGPNGMGTLTDILGVHFGPGIDSAERNGWGQWFRGDRRRRPRLYQQRAQPRPLQPWEFA